MYTDLRKPQFGMLSLLTPAIETVCHLASKLSVCFQTLHQTLDASISIRFRRDRPFEGAHNS